MDSLSARSSSATVAMKSSMSRYPSCEPSQPTYSQRSGSSASGGLLGILEGRFWPDLSAEKVQAAVAGASVSLQDERQLLQVDRHRSQRRRGSVSQGGGQLSRQIVVSLPAPVTKHLDAGGGELIGTRHSLGEGDEQTLAGELRDVGERQLGEHGHHGFAVTSCNGASELNEGALGVVHPTTMPERRCMVP